MIFPYGLKILILFVFNYMEYSLNTMSVGLLYSYVFERLTINATNYVIYTACIISMQWFK
jgi:hypothetical protein